MVEAHERFIDGLFEAGWQPGIRPEFHRGEDKQSRHAEEKSEAIERCIIRVTLS
jgi:hypothetical protein